eukprot:scaffold213616_cov39-Tisochrysis_lutea.AAC.1
MIWFTAREGCTLLDDSCSIVKSETSTESTFAGSGGGDGGELSGGGGGAGHSVVVRQVSSPPLVNSLMIASRMPG